MCAERARPGSCEETIQFAAAGGRAGDDTLRDLPSAPDACDIRPDGQGTCQAQHAAGCRGYRVRSTSAYEALPECVSWAGTPGLIIRMDDEEQTSDVTLVADCDGSCRH